MAHGNYMNKVAVCNPCGYYKVIESRFSTNICPKCGIVIPGHADKQWMVNNVNPKWNDIPDEVLNKPGSEGFINK